MPRFVKSGQFWGGFVAGLVIGPWVLGKVAPSLKSKIPQG